MSDDPDAVTSRPEPSRSSLPSIAVVIPAYNVAAHLGTVLEEVPGFVSHIVVVDDASRDATAAVARSLGDPRVVLVSHQTNRGVGAAVMTGYSKCMELGAEIVVKMDGDGQMDVRHLPNLIEPLLSRQADYGKGNRFLDLKALRQMPGVRRFGNTALTFLTKIVSGYWTVCDPTNGYTAIRREALQRLDFSRIDTRYFFETAMLINLNIVGAVVCDVAIPARYADERSSMRISRVLRGFPLRLAVGLWSRLYWRHMVLEFSPAALFLILGLPSFLFGLSFGLWRWWISIQTHVTQSTGTVILAMLPFLVGLELLIQALVVDIQSEPRVPLAVRYRNPRLAVDAAIDVGIERPDRAPAGRSRA
jgi:dolichol-phosphate mannosyltransferase